MKNDLLTSIIAATVGIVASYVVTNMFFGELEDFSISTVDPNLTVKLAEPNNEVFNYLAVNPTVEVFVGECDEYDEKTGECLDKDVESSENITPAQDESDTEDKSKDKTKEKDEDEDEDEDETEKDEDEDKENKKEEEEENF